MEAVRLKNGDWSVQQAPERGGPHSPAIEILVCVEGKALLGKIDV